MADDIQSNIRINVDTSDAMASIRSLQAQISAFHQQMQKSGSAANAAASANMQRNLINSINATKQFSASIATVSTETESFTNALEKNKLSMGQYFRYAGASSKTFGRMFKGEFDTISKVAESRVRTLQTQYIKMGRDASGAMKAMKVRPLSLDMQNLSTQTMIASQKQQIFNQLLRQGSTNLLNFGKNTQWAGRQLMVGFTVPLSIMGATAIKEFQKIEEQVIRLKRVYGDMFTTDAETEKAIQSVRQLADEFTKYGIAVESTIGLAASVAQMGNVGADMINQVTEATKLAVLGGMEQEKALDTTISLTNAFGIATEDLTEKINFLNAAENQTILAIDDFTEAVPKAGSVVSQLGGSVEDLAFFLTAMREGGVNASQAANALKSSLARLINPTQQAQDDLKKLGIDIMSIVEGNVGDLRGTIFELGDALDGLQPLERSRALEELFGKFQFARMSTLFQNISKEGSQAQEILKLTRNSAAELQVLADRELARVEESPATKLQKSIEKLQASLAPIGAEFAKLITPLVEFVTGLLKKFNEMDEGAKSFVTGLVTVLGLIAPAAIMSFGLIANGIANVIKGFNAYRSFLQMLSGSNRDVTTQTQYMTQEQLEAASVAANLGQAHQYLSQQLSVEAGALNNLTAAYEAATAAMIRNNTVATGTPARPVRVAPPVTRAPAGRRAGSPAGPVGYNKGTLNVPGPRGAGDIVPAVLSPGEAVIPAKQSQKYSGFLEAIMNDEVPGMFFGGIAGMLRRSRVATRMNSSTFMGSLRSGDLSYKSGFATGTGADFTDRLGRPMKQHQLMRRQAESNLYGTPIGSNDPSMRPTYGSVAMSPLQRILSILFGGRKGRQFASVTNPMAPSLDQYGDISLIGKRGMNARASTFVGDTLLKYSKNPAWVRGTAPMRGATPEQMKNAGYGTFDNPFGAVKDARGGVSQNTAPQYIEAQTMGGFNYNEIDKIVTKNPAVKRQLKQELKAAGLGNIRVGGPGFISNLFTKLGVPGFKDGVFSLPGPKGAGDIIPAMLAPGEAVVPAQQTQKYAGLIKGIISDNIPGFSNGYIYDPNEQTELTHLQQPTAVVGESIINPELARRGLATTSIGESSEFTQGNAVISGSLTARLPRGLNQNMKEGSAGVDINQFNAAWDGTEDKLLDSLKTGFEDMGEAFDPNSPEMKQAIAELEAEIKKNVNELAKKTGGVVKDSTVSEATKIATDKLKGTNKAAKAADAASKVPYDYRIKSNQADTAQAVKQGDVKIEKTATGGKLVDAKSGMRFGRVDKRAGLTRPQQMDLFEQKGVSAVSSMRLKTGEQRFIAKKAALESKNFSEEFDKNSEDPYMLARDNRNSPHPQAGKDGADDARAYGEGYESQSQRSGRRSKAPAGAPPPIPKPSSGAAPTSTTAPGGPPQTTVSSANNNVLDKIKREKEAMRANPTPSNRYPVDENGFEIIPAPDHLFSPTELEERNRQRTQSGAPVPPGQSGPPTPPGQMPTPPGQKPSRRASAPAGPAVSMAVSPGGVPQPGGYTSPIVDPLGTPEGKRETKKSVGGFVKNFGSKFKNAGKTIGNQILDSVEDTPLGRGIAAKLGAAAGNTVVDRDGNVMYDADTDTSYDKDGNAVGAGYAANQAAQNRAEAGEITEDILRDPETGDPVLDKKGKTISKKEAEKQTRKNTARQKRGMVAGRLAGAMGSASMMLGMASMMPGIGDNPIMQQIQGFMPALFALSAVLPMLAALPLPITAIVVAVGALAAAFIAVNSHFDKIKEKSMQMADSLSVGSDFMKRFGQETGNATAGEIRDVQREEDQALINVQAGKGTFGEKFLQGELGQEMLSNTESAIAGIGRADTAEDLATQLSMAIASGAIDRAQAVSIAGNIGRELDDTNFAVNVIGQMTEVLGPNGEDLENDPYEVGVRLIGRIDEDVDVALDDLEQNLDKYGNVSLNPFDASGFSIDVNEEQALNRRELLNENLSSVRDEINEAGFGWTTPIADIVTLPSKITDFVSTGVSDFFTDVGNNLGIVSDEAAKATKETNNLIRNTNMFDRTIAQINTEDAIKTEYIEDYGLYLAKASNGVSGLQESLDASTVAFDRQIAAAREAGDIERVAFLEDKQLAGRQKMMDQYADTLEKIRSGFAGIASESTKSDMLGDLDERILDGLEGDIKKFTQEALDNIDEQLSEGIISSDQAYMIKLQLDAGNIDVDTVNTLMRMESENFQTAFNVMMNIGAKDTKNLLRISNIFLDKNGNPDPVQQKKFLAKFEGMDANEVEDNIQLWNRISSMSGLVDEGTLDAISDFYLNNSKAAKNLREDLKALEDPEVFKFLEDNKDADQEVVITYIQETIGEDVAESVKGNYEYFNSLDPVNQILYLQVVGTMLLPTMSGANDSDVLDFAVAEGIINNPDAFEYYTSNEEAMNRLRRKYVEHKGELATIQNMFSDLGSSLDDGSGDGSGGPVASSLDGILNKLRDVRDETVQLKNTWVNSFAEINRVVGEGIDKFEGLSQQLRKLGANQPLIDYILGMSPEEYEERKNEILDFSGGKVVGLKEGAENIQVALNAIKLGEFQDQQMASIEAINAQRKAITKLVGSGYSLADAYGIAADETLAYAIAGEENINVLNELIAATNEATEATEEFAAAQKLAQDTAALTSKTSVVSWIQENIPGISKEMFDSIVGDSFTSGLLSTLQDGGQITQEDVSYLEKWFANIADQANLDLTINDIKFARSPLDRFSEGIGNVMKKFSVMQTTIELKYKAINRPDEEIIKAAENDIALLNYEADDLQAGLDEIADQEEEVNKKYEARFEALEDIDKVNERIEKRQKAQLTIADALSKGDISAAAAAVQQLRADERADRASSVKQALQKRQENELADLRAQNGQTREQLEERLKEIQIEIREIEESRLEPAQERIRLQTILMDQEIESLSVLDKTREEWENIQNAVDIATTKTDDFVASLKTARDIAAEIANGTIMPNDLNTVPTPDINIDDLIGEDQISDGDSDTEPGQTFSEYRASKGESLSDVSRKTGVSVSDLLKYNQKFTDPNAKGYKSGYKGGDYLYSNTLVNIPDWLMSADADLSSGPANQNTSTPTKNPPSNNVLMEDLSKKADSFRAAAFRGKTLWNSSPSARNNNTYASIASAIKSYNPVADKLTRLGSTRKKLRVVGTSSSSNLDLQYYRMGGLIPYKASGGLFTSINTDTVPAMLTPGEFVVRRYAVEKYGTDKLKAINSGTYSGESVYNYSVNVNVKSDANPDEIARTVMSQIKRIDSQKIRGNRF